MDLRHKLRMMAEFPKSLYSNLCSRYLPISNVDYYSLTIISFLYTFRYTFQQAKVHLQVAHCFIAARFQLVSTSISYENVILHPVWLLHIAILKACIIGLSILSIFSVYNIYFPSRLEKKKSLKPYR